MPHSVPWLTDLGDHSAAVARQVAFMAAQGQEGLGSPLDCRVSALDVPGPFIRAGVGSYQILNRSPGHPDQMYVGRITGEDRVAVSPTSSTGGRTDLVVIRIEDPSVDSWPLPSQANRATGPYAFTRVIPNVPAGTTSPDPFNEGWSALALARITIPANTGTITSGMITELRQTKQTPFPAPAQFTDIQNYTNTSSLGPPPAGSGTRFGAWQQWPSGAEWNVPVPDWATQVQCYYQVNAALSDNTWGGMSVQFNGRWTPEVVFDVNYPLISDIQRCRYTNNGGMRDLYTCGGTLPVLAADRGKVVPVRVMGRTFDSGLYGARGTSRADRGSMGFFQLTFKQNAVAA